MSPTTIDSTWVRLGATPPDTLTDARLQVHHAAQIAVAATISYLSARPDDSHTALTWSETLRALVTEPIDAPRPFRIALRPADLTLAAVRNGVEPGRPFGLAGNTVASAYEWLAAVAGDSGLDRTRLTARRHYDIAGHPVANGSPFALEPRAAFAELEHYWSNASRVLADLVRATEGASPVFVWPHHFDIATLISLRPPATHIRGTIGVGHSPGDEWYAEPYWYVGPSPYPPTANLPALDVGHWHTKGWVGAALPASEYVNADPTEQRRLVSAFIDSAVRACRLVMG